MAVIGELATAMESDGGGVVVVLADAPSKKEFDMTVCIFLDASMTHSRMTRPFSLHVL